MSYLKRKQLRPADVLCEVCFSYGSRRKRSSTTRRRPLSSRCGSKYRMQYHGSGSGSCPGWVVGKAFCCWCVFSTSETSWGKP